mgnify:CR=1 FL=1
MMNDRRSDMLKIFFKRKYRFSGYILLITAFVSSCEVNPLTSKNKETIKSEHNETVNVPAEFEISENFAKQALESKEFEVFILQQFKILENQLSSKLNSIDPLDTEQIQQIVQKELITFLKNKQDMKYQFLCDENERWIYRCNRMTGEIECFSMSSNKLRLLSSTR